VIETLEHVADDLTHRLEGREVVFGLLVAGHEGLGVLAHAFETGFHFAVFADFGAVLFEDLFSFGGGGRCRWWCGWGGGGGGHDGVWKVFGDLLKKFRCSIN